MHSRVSIHLQHNGQSCWLSDQDGSHRHGQVWGRIYDVLWFIAVLVTSFVGFIHSNMERALPSSNAKLEPGNSSTSIASGNHGAPRADQTLLNGPEIPESKFRLSPLCWEGQLNITGWRASNIPRPDQCAESHGFCYSHAIASQRWTWTSEHDHDHNLWYTYNCELGKAKKQKFYAVAIDRHPGIFLTWPEAKWLVDRFSRACHKAFKTIPMAKQYLKQELALLTPLPEPIHRVNCHYRGPNKQDHHVFECECYSKCFCTNGKDGSVLY